jgi:hypothetical protein
MACKDCFDNCGDPTPDVCVKYTGADIPLFDICQGDPLSKLDVVLVEKLLSALDGTGITVNDVTLNNAPFLKAIFASKDKTLVNLLQLLIDSNQTLRSLISGLTISPSSYNTSCLVGLPTNPKQSDIINGLLNLVCQQQTALSKLPTVYVKQTDLPNLVKAINNSGATSSIPNYRDRMVPYVAYEYYGSLANFDNTGKGIASAGFDKVFLCNGLNGTIDRRGRTGVGAVKNVPGASLDNTTNPSNALNALFNVNYAVGEKFGENGHKLTVNELAPHTHAVSDPGHEHPLPTDAVGSQDMKSITVTPNADEAYSTTNPTGKSTTNISIGSAGNGDLHNNRQPSIAALYITYLP